MIAIDGGERERLKTDLQFLWVATGLFAICGLWV